VEASLGATHTEELAVMMDTFRPLQVTKAALELEDPNYPFSWLGAPIQPDSSGKTDTW
jgi:homogentisate 1,2-dioxygenase